MTSDKLLYGFKMGELVLVAYRASGSQSIPYMTWKNVPQVGVHFYDRQKDRWMRSSHNWDTLERNILQPALYRPEYVSKTEWHLEHETQY